MCSGPIRPLERLQLLETGTKTSTPASTCLLYILFLHLAEAQKPLGNKEQIRLCRGEQTRQLERVVLISGVEPVCALRRSSTPPDLERWSHDGGWEDGCRRCCMSNWSRDTDLNPATSQTNPWTTTNNRAFTFTFMHLEDALHLYIYICVPGAQKQS